MYHNADTDSQRRHNAEHHYLGCFSTGEKAALCSVRWLRDPASADETAQVQQQTTTSTEAVVEAVTEELTLVRVDTTSGFRNVCAGVHKYMVKIVHNGEHHHIGAFHSPEEAAALHVAGWLHDHESLAATAPAAASLAATHRRRHHHLRCLMRHTAYRYRCLMKLSGTPSTQAATGQQRTSRSFMLTAARQSAHSSTSSTGRRCAKGVSPRSGGRCPPYPSG